MSEYSNAETQATTDRLKELDRLDTERRTWCCCGGRLRIEERRYMGYWACKLCGKPIRKRAEGWRRDLRNAGRP